ncbi:hypothetical protein [Leptolyngbya sp. 7M]|uniref:hypothetical protein n=1 Tax=Leptolyngbya sp. 7M TaxID=2812896 RepID=UPI001B8BB66D|nr:hypothetical protein [Leptolyngbya sp. 7M]QYO67749.1 hypothetical protein JVX88_13740 [Leptolyngbya sp. 7M]
MVVVFDERSTVGLVKLRTKRASYEVAASLEEASRANAAFVASENVFSEITDEDIDSLFS